MLLLNWISPGNATRFIHEYKNECTLVRVRFLLGPVCMCILTRIFVGTQVVNKPLLLLSRETRTLTIDVDSFTSPLRSPNGQRGRMDRVTFADKHDWYQNKGKVTNLLDDLYILLFSKRIIWVTLKLLCSNFVLNLVTLMISSRQRKLPAKYYGFDWAVERSVTGLYQVTRCKFISFYI